MQDDTNADVVRRRRAVFGALLTVFPPADAHAAVAIWDRDYRHGRSQYDGLNVFARQVCGQFDQPGRHRELIQRLMEYFFAPEDVLPPDPGPHTDPRRVDHASPPEPVARAVSVPVPVMDAANSRDAPDRPGQRHIGAPPNVAVWLKLLQRFVADLQPHNRAAATSLVRAMLQASSALGVDPVSRELVRLALEGRNNERLHRVTDANLRALLNFAYVHAASATGPVVADRVLGLAVAAVEAMPEAALFSPRKLL